VKTSEPLQAGSAVVSDDERLTLNRLMRVHGPGGLKAALLACLLTPDNSRSVLAWREETAATPDAETVLVDTTGLSPAARLPWFEVVLTRLSGTTLPERKELLRAARRVLVASRKGRPLDRLLWLATRRRFGDSPWITSRVPADVDIAQLPEVDLLDVARYTAFLACMVPTDEHAHTAGTEWYAAVMSHWQPPDSVPPCRRPDVDALVNALHGLQALSWMQRPLLVRAWVAEALTYDPRGQLSASAADALRLTCLLLDCPMPPELARHYIELVAKEKTP
jgi:hypothetical protein